MVRPFLLGTGLLLLGSCAQQHTPEPTRDVLGVLTLTVGEDTGAQKQALSMPSRSIQLKATGTRVVDVQGFRYISTTYQVRNAQSNGVAYTTSKKNITLLGFEATGNLQRTAVRSLKKADGTAASSLLALQVMPAASIQASSGTPVLSTDPQSFQAYTQPEVSALLTDPLVQSYGVQNIFPYGYVVTRDDGSRTLSASPGSTLFEGKVTLSVKIPLQNPVANTPRSVTLTLLAVEDSATRVTQALEEHGQPDAQVLSRVNQAGATEVNTFSGTTYNLSPKRLICQVSVSSGTSPVFLVNTPTPAAFSPATGTPVSRQATFSASFTDLGCAEGIPQLGNTPHQQFVVQGSQTGIRQAGSGTFSQSGNVWSFTPAAGQEFKPGETVNITLTDTRLGGQSTRYVVQSSPQVLPGFEDGGSFPMGGRAASLEFGDVNNDGHLDLVSGAHTGTVTVLVLPGNGTGQFPTSTTFTQGTGTTHVALGDFNRDGNLDLFTTNGFNQNVSVRLGNGDGTFAPKLDQGVGNTPIRPQLGDFNGDGFLDAVVVNTNGSSITVLLGKGDGTFTSRTDVAVVAPVDVTTGDLDEDGDLDLIVANGEGEGFIQPGTFSITVLKGNGQGGFTAEPSLPLGRIPVEVFLADLNKDSNLDLAVRKANGEFGVLLGDGAGNLGSISNNSISSFTEDSVIGDINGDGNLDFITSNVAFEQRLQVHTGKGNGSFDLPLNVPAVAPDMLAIGDVNGDGRLDIAASNANLDQFQILLKK